MATRSQIRFVDNYGTIAQVYRHSDGYPNGDHGVIADLVKLRNMLFFIGRSKGDPSYTAANFIFLQKLEHASSMLQFSKDKDELTVNQILDWEKTSNELDLKYPYFMLGYGVENPANGIHGDEEYLYIVNVDENGWGIKVSGHNEFPCSGDDRTLAFDKTNWKFEGNLTDAFLHYVSKSKTTIKLAKMEDG